MRSQILIFQNNDPPYSDSDCPQKVQPLPRRNNWNNEYEYKTRSDVKFSNETKNYDEAIAELNRPKFQEISQTTQLAAEADKFG